jgi:hypothetical protein
MQYLVSHKSYLSERPFYLRQNSGPVIQLAKLLIDIRSELDFIIDMTCSDSSEKEKLEQQLAKLPDQCATTR